MKTNLVIASLLLVGTIGAAQEAALAQADLADVAGTLLGKATFTENLNGVEVALGVKGLEPGYHGIHIHQTGSCEPPDFASAGGHFNPTGKVHGLRNAEGPHAADMPNLLVNPDGTASAVFLLPLLTLGQGENSLFKEDGTALVIHAGPDDQVTDPAGNAGDRVACGVIEALP